MYVNSLKIVLFELSISLHLGLKTCSERRHSSIETVRRREINKTNEFFAHFKIHKIMTCNSLNHETPNAKTVYNNNLNDVRIFKVFVIIIKKT